MLAEQSSLQSRKGGFGLTFDFQMVHVHWSQAQLNDRVEIVLGQEVAVHQFDHLRHGFFAIPLQLVDESLPKHRKVLLTDLMSITRRSETHMTLNILDKADQFA